jgi:hypothetical protein
MTRIILVPFALWMQEPPEWDGSWTAFVTRDRLMGLPTVLMMWQYAGLYWLDRNVPHARKIFAPLVLIFLIENFVYQVLVGSFIFWDRPRHLQFTQRIQWMADRGDPRVGSFVEVLNEHDKGHIDL